MGIIDEQTINEDHEPAPVTVETRCGCVEYAAWGEGPAVMTLHGATDAGHGE